MYAGEKYLCGGTDDIVCEYVPSASHSDEADGRRAAIPDDSKPKTTTDDRASANRGDHSLAFSVDVRTSSSVDVMSGDRDACYDGSKSNSSGRNARKTNRKTGDPSGKNSADRVEKTADDFFGETAGGRVVRFATRVEIVGFTIPVNGRNVSMAAKPDVLRSPADIPETDASRPASGRSSKATRTTRPRTKSPTGGRDQSTPIAPTDDVATAWTRGPSALKINPKPSEKKPENGPQNRTRTPNASSALSWYRRPGFSTPDPETN